MEYMSVRQVTFLQIVLEQGLYTALNPSRFAQSDLFTIQILYKVHGVKAKDVGHIQMSPLKHMAHGILCCPYSTIFPGPF